MCRLINEVYSSGLMKNKHRLRELAAVDIRGIKIPNEHVLLITAEALGFHMDM